MIINCNLLHSWLKLEAILHVAAEPNPVEESLQIVCSWMDSEIIFLSPGYTMNSQLKSFQVVQIFKDRNKYEFPSFDL